MFFVHCVWLKMVSDGRITINVSSKALQGTSLLVQQMDTQKSRSNFRMLAFVGPILFSIPYLLNHGIP